jgi:hypothetical protein
MPNIIVATETGDKSFEASHIQKDSAMAVNIMIRWR